MALDSQTALFTHPDCSKHLRPGHPECPERLDVILNRFDEAGLAAELSLRLPEPASEATLKRAHSSEYIRQIHDLAPTSGLLALDADTYMSAGSLNAAKIAAGACVQAVELILDNQIKRAFCAVRPPGHHAEIGQAMGFCLFNNIALAAETALLDTRIARVAILDFDVHHCNGTVDIFKERNEVLVCSSFQENHYPNRYLDYTNAHIINTPLAPGSDGSQFRKAVESVWMPALLRQQPDMIFISAGFDAHKKDPLGQLNLENEDFYWVTREILFLAEQICDGRIVSTLEGGYNLDALADSVEAHMQALLE